MTMAGKAYVVRDDTTVSPATGSPTTGPPTSGAGSVHRLYPYTLKGLTEALEEARFRSFSGPPQVVAVVAESGSKVIRRFENGHEVPATSAQG